MYNENDLAYDFFAVLLTVIEYMESSSEKLLTLLRNCDQISNEDSSSRYEYEARLNNIKTRAEKMKEGLLKISDVQLAFVADRQNKANIYSVLSEGFDELIRVSGALSENHLYVNENGRLSYSKQK